MNEQTNLTNNVTPSTPVTNTQVVPIVDAINAELGTTPVQQPQTTAPVQDVPAIPVVNVQTPVTNTVVPPQGETILTESQDSSTLDVLSDTPETVQDVQNIDVSIPFM